MIPQARTWERTAYLHVSRCSFHKLRVVTVSVYPQILVKSLGENRTETRCCVLMLTTREGYARLSWLPIAARRLTRRSLVPR